MLRSLGVVNALVSVEESVTRLGEPKRVFLLLVQGAIQNAKNAEPLKRLLMSMAVFAEHVSLKVKKSDTLKRLLRKENPLEEKVEIQFVSVARLKSLLKMVFAMHVRLVESVNIMQKTKIQKYINSKLLQEQRLIDTLDLDALRSFLVKCVVVILKPRLIMKTMTSLWMSSGFVENIMLKYIKRNLGKSS